MRYGHFAYIYDKLMEDMPYPLWLRFLRKCWGDFGGKTQTIVDLGCGTGNLSIPLAQSGLRVYGIDLSNDMLAVAQDKMSQQQRTFPFASGGSVTWLAQDMREWEIAEPVDSVISCCDCMNYLTEEEELSETFRQTYAGLKPGGTFIFDVHTEHQLITYADMQPFTLNEEDVSYIWTSELDEDRCEIEHHLTIFVSEKQFALTDSPEQLDAGKYVRIDERHVQRAYPLTRIEALLEEAGFADVRIFADFTRKAPTAATERAFFVCVKR